MDAEKKEVLDAVRAARKKNRSSRARDWTIYLIVIALVALMGLGWWSAENRYSQEREGRITAQENRNDLEDAFIELTNEYQDRTGETPDVTIPAETPSPSSAPTTGTPGEDGEDGRDGRNGLDGRSVTGVTCNGDGSWTFLFSDGRSSRVSGPCVGATGNVGPIGPQGAPGVGQTGATGPQGVPGESIVGPPGPQGVPGQSITGPAGPAGSNGTDGRGVQSMQCNADGTWLIAYTDGTTQMVEGPCRVPESSVPLFG